MVPLFALKPFASRTSLKRSNTARSSLRSLSCSAKSQMVFASGTMSENLSSRKSRQEILSRIFSSFFSSERLCRFFRMGILNMSMISKGFRPALASRSFSRNFVEVWAERFPIDESVEFGQEVVQLIDFVELVFDIEE